MASAAARAVAVASMQGGGGGSLHARAAITAATRRMLLLRAAAAGSSASSFSTLRSSSSLRTQVGQPPQSHSYSAAVGMSSATTKAGEQGKKAVSFKEAMQQLAAFPEVAEAAKHRAEKHLTRALPLLQRAVEVLDASMGQGSVLSEAARFQMALCQLEAGDYAAAHDMLEGLVERVQPETNTVHDAVVVRLLLGGAALFRGCAGEAVDYAQEALAFCENRAESYTELLSRCYGLAGVCDMYGGEWEDAYDRLQKAARMAGAPTWQCRSASTLGAFHLFTGKEGGPKEAVAVWEETLQALDRPAAGTEGAKEAALAEAGLWLNLAEVYLGDLGGEEGAKLRDLAKAEEAASKALKLQEGLLAPNDPRMGRTLAAIARHRHLIGQAVSAEGLYRSALDLLTAPANQICPQGRHALCRAYHGYADLLADWEKREREAADARAKAKAVPLLRLSPTVPMGGMVFIEGGTPGEVDYF